MNRRILKFTFYTVAGMVFFLASGARAAVPTFDVGLNPLLNVTQPAIVSNTNAIATAQAGQYQKEIGIPPPTLLPYLSPATLASSVTCTGLDCLAWIIAKLALHQLMQQIVQWIRTGNIDGGPLFVTDWEKFLLNAKDKASSLFLNELGATNLCQPFRAPIQKALSNNIFGGGRTFNQRASCTMNNMQNFLSNPESGGGWDAWYQLTQSEQNNPYSSYLSGIESLETSRGNAIQKNQNEALASLGLLGTKTCEPATIETEAGDVPLGENCTITTPGKAVEAQLSEVLQTDLKQLNLANEIDETLSALLNSLLQSILFSITGLLNYNGQDTPDPPNPFPSVNIPTPTPTPPTGPICGDGVCSAGESCPADCSVNPPPPPPPPPPSACNNNGTCDAGESAISCPADCTTVAPPPPPPPPPPP